MPSAAAIRRQVNRALNSSTTSPTLRRRCSLRRTRCLTVRNQLTRTSSNAFVSQARCLGKRRPSQESDPESQRNGGRQSYGSCRGSSARLWSRAPSAQRTACPCIDRMYLGQVRADPEWLRRPSRSRGEVVAPRRITTDQPAFSGGQRRAERREVHGEPARRRGEQVPGARVESEDEAPDRA